MPLRASVTIADDEWGVPHIRASSIPDAYFGQGYVVARDRLFQIDLQLRRDLGRLAEAFGARFVPHDHTARLLLYRGDVESELTGLPPDVFACARAYVDGINARIAELEGDPSLLPPEYDVPKLQPLRWDIADLVRVRRGDMGSVTDEIRRARLATLGLLDLDTLVAPLAGDRTPQLPEGLDLAAVSQADLGILGETEEPLPWSGTSPAGYDPVEDRLDRDAHGSNAWTISSARSATGRPILANDPHLGIGGFSPRHLAHLTAPGFDVIGAGSPGMPGIMQGHTDHYAFGRTNSHIDQEDLYILELNPDDPECYRHRGQWKRFARATETIRVKDANDVAVTLRHAEHGPVLLHDPSRLRATAMASASLLPGANMTFAIIALNLAGNWDEIAEAARLHVAPTNFHYADIDGNTGWRLLGHVPIRNQADGLLPVPGDGRHDWQGILPAEQMPTLLNPAQGWFASANQFNLPPEWSSTKGMTSFTWNAPYRYDRVAHVLGEADRHSVADSVALQHDDLSLPAQALLPLLPKALDGMAGRAAAMLSDWDARLGADSAAAALFEMLWIELGKACLAAIVPDRARELVTSIDPRAMLALLTHPDTRFGPDPEAARDALLAKALGRAWETASEALGTDPAAWRWGDIHRVVLRHPLSGLPAIDAALPVIEGGRSGGDTFTVMARGYVATRDYHVSHGASVLMVCDVGDWDRSCILTLPGQSIDPRSPHYRDGYATWVAGRPRPFPFGRKAVDAHIRQVTELHP
ncbi:MULTISPECIES: penicillin acylase family protein [unclassified Sphingomonas]|uniref:penicillin acylase family protein n=1 Tax=unclassified Sphingomonas TaxID=196159 RepID=UPI0028598FD4|nr:MULTISPECIES: penicillin acylase family protein [unclassified Sphingomonas]MDR6116221.1 penicillin amidase [Sphingomonas sp. SORGH_AS_0789]MDR6150104.1 penicillin amidase [Sphingomonas sp. SORGH_AS_0742]